ncbi:hypothetical protein [Cellulomonas sp.]|uniref:hypothetical protein n=1 Tax=Cellulomonas sp. TaxID=40001 RepID=UPI001B16BB8A|nr:hypothetical protein [Cellulomonas sp.]MBO9553199.1 hypothetical protein [Cellulomonas sp.]
MTPPPAADRPTGKAPRRAVRRAGTVGNDDTVLVSTLPAFPAQDARATTTGPAASEATSTGTPDPAVAVRSADDSDVGWGGSDDSNDDRLHRDKPPHW